MVQPQVRKTCCQGIGLLPLGRDHFMYHGSFDALSPLLLAFSQSCVWQGYRLSTLMLSPLQGTSTMSTSPLFSSALYVDCSARGKKRPSICSIKSKMDEYGPVAFGPHIMKKLEWLLLYLQRLQGQHALHYSASHIPGGYSEWMWSSTCFPLHALYWVNG